MVVKNTISRNNESELSIQMFSEAADDIATCSDELLLVAEALAQSCLMIGDTGVDYREVLTSRAKDFKTLAGLYKTRSRRFEDIVERLAGDIQEDVDLPEYVLV
jgi:hypothetical protein